jgi:hypothetical protein
VGVDETRAVFERENTDGAVWTPTGEDYDEFLWHFVVEAVFGGDIGAGANNVDADGFQRRDTAWAPIDVRPWRWPGPDHRLWVRDGVLAWTVVNDSPDAPANESSYYSISIGRDRDIVQAGANRAHHVLGREVAGPRRALPGRDRGDHRQE